MKEMSKTIIKNAHMVMSDENFNQWLLEYLIKDINDQGRDSLRLEILRFVAEEGLI